MNKMPANSPAPSCSGEGEEVAPACQSPRGLICPRCGCRHLLVHYTRPRVGYILRVRLCRHCGRKMATRERP